MKVMGWCNLFIQKNQKIEIRGTSYDKGTY